MVGCCVVFGAVLVLVRLLAWPVAFAFAIWLLIGAARGEELIAPTPEEYADIQKWIPQTCCWTNNCCRKVHESALTSLPKNQIEVRSTGQVLPRTGWSQDKNTWRCTCDHIEGKWVVHPQAHTRCVFDHPASY